MSPSYGSDSDFEGDKTVKSDEGVNSSNSAVDSEDGLNGSDGAVSSDDEGWTLVTDEAGDTFPPEQGHELARLSRSNELTTLRLATRALQSHAKIAGIHLKAKAVEAAIDAAGLAAYIVKDQACAVAEGTGWLTNCDTADEFVKRVAARYPILEKTQRAMATIKEAFIKGRNDAAAGRLRRASEARRMQGQGKLVASKPIDRAMFAVGEGEFDEVPLDDEQNGEVDLNDGFEEIGEGAFD